MKSIANMTVTAPLVPAYEESTVGRNKRRKQKHFNAGVTQHAAKFRQGLRKYDVPARVLPEPRGDETSIANMTFTAPLVPAYKEPTRRPEQAA